MTEIIEAINKFADVWGWPLTIAIVIGIFVAKNWEKIWGKLDPIWAAKHQAQLFAREQKAKAAVITWEQQERQDTILILKDTLKLLRDDRDLERIERKALQDRLVDIEKERARREAETTEILRGMMSLISLQTDRLSDLAQVLERVVGAYNYPDREDRQ